MVFHIFLSKCNPLVLCAASTHDALEMKPSALLVPLLKGLESCIHSSGSREENPNGHWIGRENNFQVWKAAAEEGYLLLVRKNRLRRHYLHLINQKWHQRELVLQTINETHNNETNHIIDHKEVIQCNEYWYQVSEPWALGIQFQIYSSECGSSVSRKIKKRIWVFHCSHWPHPWLTIVALLMT